MDTPQPIQKMENAIRAAVRFSPDLALVAITGHFVGLVTALAHARGHDADREIKIDGGQRRDITIHAQKAGALPLAADDDSSIETSEADARPFPPVSAVCACFPGVCRGGQVVNGKLPSGQQCREMSEAAGDDPGDESHHHVSRGGSIG